MKQRWILLCLAVLLSPLRVFGQADQSANFTPPTAIYHGSGIESVSLPMRNVHISIPLIHLRGRGLDLDINATFNNETWSTNEVVNKNGDHFFVTAPGMRSGGDLSCGWSVGVARMGNISTSTQQCVFFSSDGSCIQYVVYANFITAEGSTIQLGDDSGIHGPGSSYPTSFWSSDG